jgi:hypothetical protein
MNASPSDVAAALGTESVHPRRDEKPKRALANEEVIRYFFHTRNPIVISFTMRHRAHPSRASLWGNP